MSTAVPTNKEEFLNHCKHRLGFPVVTINISQDQEDICFEQAKLRFEEFHHEATENYLVSQQITQADLDNGFFTPPASVRDVNGVLSFTANLNNFTRRSRFNSGRTWHRGGLASGFGSFTSPAIDYYLAQQTEAYYDEIMNSTIPFVWNRHSRRLRLQDDSLKVDYYIAYSAVMSMLDEGITGVWSNDWFARYCAALMKRQWGINLSKFTGIELPGGIQFNGTEILRSAEEELEKLMEEVREEHDQDWPGIMFG